jgi:hypothetical protein
VKSGAEKPFCGARISPCVVLPAGDLDSQIQADPNIKIEIDKAMK